MKEKRLSLIRWSLILSVAMLFTLAPASALEVRGVTDDVLKEVFTVYGEDAEVRPLESIAVYVNPFSQEVYYEIPVYSQRVLVGSFSVNEQGMLRQATQSIHLVDFLKIQDIETYIHRIEDRESAVVKDWKYIFMRDMYTSAVMYQLDNGNTGMYVLTSRVLKTDVCLSMSDWQYQVEYFEQAEWNDHDLQYINNLFEEAEIVLCLILMLVFVVLIWSAVQGEISRREEGAKNSELKQGG